MYDAIIVGAGFAGLSAAKELIRRGCSDILVLEARDRVGGRTRKTVVGGLAMDLGGMWIGPTQTRMVALAEDYQVRKYETPIRGRNILRITGKERFSEGDDFESFFSLREKISLFRIEREIRSLSKTLSSEEPWRHPQAQDLDSRTVESWIAQMTKSPRVRQFFRLVCFSLFCAEASQVSLLFFLHYLKSGDGLEPMLSSGTGSAQNFLLHGGVHQIAAKMADELGDRVRLESPVRRVEWSEGAAQVYTDDACHEARTVIVSVPPTLVERIDFAPALPRPKKAFHARLAMGSAIKYCIVFETPFWREQGFNGFILRDDVPCAPCLDVSPPGQPKGVIAGFFDGDHALNHSGLGMDARRAIVLRTLADHFGPRALSPIEYVDVDWLEEQWSGGCYGAFAGPGIFSRYGENLRRRVGPLFWAGTETSTRWTGYIEGAVRSGERAAQEVADQLLSMAAVAK
ncbi:MAG: FAD-dependent oxidoreductase [Myxococcota bacterium]